MGKTKAVNSLFSDLDNAQEHDGISSQNFIPQDALEALITVPRVKAALSIFAVGSSDFHANVVQYARKVFAILVLIGDPPAMKDLWKQGLRDHHLPLLAGNAPKDGDKLLAKTGESFGPWKNPAHLKQFLHFQWTVLAPVIDNTCQHFELNAKCAMPFVADEEVGGGAYSYVYKCELHRAHQRGLRVGPIELSGYVLLTCL
jgi:hypothetical protein